jgi:hypothetical protein
MAGLSIGPLAGTRIAVCRGVFRAADRIAAPARTGMRLKHLKANAPAPRPSGRKIGLGDLNSVGMKRPVAKRLRFAEFSLCPFRGIDFVRGVNFQQTLTNFRLPAVFAEHILQEANDKSRHQTLLLRRQHQNQCHIIRGCRDRFDRDQTRRGCPYWKTAVQGSRDLRPGGLLPKKCTSRRRRDCSNAVDHGANRGRTADVAVEQEP